MKSIRVVLRLWTALMSRPEAGWLPIIGKASMICSCYSCSLRNKINICADKKKDLLDLLRKISARYYCAKPPNRIFS